MPFYRDKMSHGHLFIKFSVIMPARGELKENQIKELQSLLPGPKLQPLDKSKKFEYLEEFDESELNPNAEGGKQRR